MESNSRMLKSFQMIRRVARVGLLSVAIVLTPHVTADSLKRANLPLIDGVTLIGVKDGKLQYRTAAGDREVPLAEVESIAVDSVPELAAGQTAIADNKMRNAEKSLASVWSKSQVEWIRHFAGYYLVQVYDKRGEPVDASAVYAKLAAENADVYFLSRPPVASLTEADEDQKKRISQQILAVAETSRGETRKLLQSYHQQVVGEGGPTIPQDNGNTNTPEAKEDLRAKAKVILPNSLWALMDRQGGKEKWAVIETLSQGEYQAALDAITPMLSGKGDLGPKLFIYGKAKLGLADQSKDKDMYRDAGLAFMRIVAHFNRPGQESPLVLPAKLEVAYLHKQIGRNDIHDRIMDEVMLGIDDAKAYPLYQKRYQQLLGEKPAAEEQP